MLSVFAVAPVVISTVELIYFRRWDLLHFVRSLPWRAATVVRLMTCTRPGPHAHDNPAPSSPRLTLQEVTVVFPIVSLPLRLTWTLTVPSRHLNNPSNRGILHTTHETHRHTWDPKVTAPPLDATSHPYPSQGTSL